MLLGVVLKYTLENHPDHRNLSDAFDMVREINAEVNEKKREYENTKKLLKIEEAIVSKKKMVIMSLQFLCLC